MIIISKKTVYFNRIEEVAPKSEYTGLITNIFGRRFDIHSDEGAIYVITDAKLSNIRENVDEIMELEINGMLFKHVSFKKPEISPVEEFNDILEPVSLKKTETVEKPEATEKLEKIKKLEKPENFEKTKKIKNTETTENFETAEKTDRDKTKTGMGKNEKIAVAFTVLFVLFNLVLWMLVHAKGN